MQERSSIETRFTWDLTRIFADDAAWEDAFAKVQNLSKEFAGKAGTLSSGREAVLNVLHNYMDMYCLLEKVSVYAMMRQNEDTTVAGTQAMYDRVMTLGSEVMADAAFLTPELLALDEGTIERYLQDPDFSDYSVFLTEVLRDRAHTLSINEERLLAMSMDAVSTGSTAAEMLRNADLDLGYVYDEDLNRVKLTDAGFLHFLENPNRRVRQSAFKGMMLGYGKMGNTFASLYSGQIKADIFESRARGFASSREAALYGNQIPESVYDSLIEAVHGGIGTLTAYLKLRKTKIDVARLHMYDLYFGNEKDFEIALDIEDAFEVFKKAVAPLGADYVEAASRALPERWIDVYENNGKRSGAYSCGSAYGVTPYVLLNHKKNYDGLSTLCHEMGHAMHSFYSNQTQPFPKADYSIFVAEVASTTNEILLNEYLRREYAENKEAQIALIGSLLEHFRTTVFRQTLFAEFEMKAHQLAENGESLTRERLSSLYLELVKVYYGKACTVDACVADEWMRIPHFYSPFYVYQYATGFCAAAALAQNILSGDEELIRKYRTFLTLGCSLPPIEELKIAGVDLSSPEPVCQALDYFAELVLKYQELLA